MFLNVKYFYAVIKIINYQKTLLLLVNLFIIRFFSSFLGKFISKN